MCNYHRCGEALLLLFFSCPVFFKKENKYSLIGTLKAGCFLRHQPRSPGQQQEPKLEFTDVSEVCQKHVPSQQGRKKALGEEKLCPFSRGLHFIMVSGPVREVTGSTSGLEGLGCAQLQRAVVC